MVRTPTTSPFTRRHRASPLPSLLLLLLLPLQRGQAASAEGSDSVSINVVFTATGGTITPRGLYTAGSDAGSFQVIAAAGSLADTSTITVAPLLGAVAAAQSAASGDSLPTRPAAGIPFGPFGNWDGSVPRANVESFTLSVGSEPAPTLVRRIDRARASGLKLLVAMTGGGHSRYMTNGVFDIRKWWAKMETYNTEEIRQAVAAAVADGTIIGNSVMDEPHVYGLGDGNTWGPRGTMTKRRVDEMCAYVKRIFPTLPVGVVHPHQAFEPDQSYVVCDFILDQYTHRKGSITRYRDEALAMGKRDGIAIAFSLNVLNGGTQAPRDGAWNCSPETTGGRGTYRPNCRMTPDQVREWGVLLGSSGCALALWRYDEAFMSRPENQAALKQVSERLAILPARPCRKGPGGRSVLPLQ